MTRTYGALAVSAAVLALVLAAPATANHTLAHKVKALQAKLNCLQKYPVFAFGDYAYFDFEQALANQGTGQDNLDVLVPPVPTISALDFDYAPNPGPSDAFFLGVKRTSSCLSKFSTAANPVSFARVVSTAKMSRLQ